MIKYYLTKDNISHCQLNEYKLAPVHTAACGGAFGGLSPPLTI